MAETNRRCDGLEDDFPFPGRPVFSGSMVSFWGVTYKWAMKKILVGGFSFGIGDEQLLSYMGMQINVNNKRFIQIYSKCSHTPKD